MRRTPPAEAAPARVAPRLPDSGSEAPDGCPVVRSADSRCSSGTPGPPGRQDGEHSFLRQGTVDRVLTKLSNGLLIEAGGARPEREHYLPGPVPGFSSTGATLPAGNRTATSGRPGRQRAQDAAANGSSRSCGEPGTGRQVWAMRRLLHRAGAVMGKSRTDGRTAMRPAGHPSGRMRGGSGRAILLLATERRDRGSPPGYRVRREGRVHGVLRCPVVGWVRQVQRGPTLFEHTCFGLSRMPTPGGGARLPDTSIPSAQGHVLIRSLAESPRVSIPGRVLPGACGLRAAPLKAGGDQASTRCLRRINPRSRAGGYSERSVRSVRRPVPAPSFKARDARADNRLVTASVRVGADEPAPTAGGRLPWVSDVPGAGTGLKIFGQGVGACERTRYSGVRNRAAAAARCGRVPRDEHPLRSRTGGTGSRPWSRGSHARPHARGRSSPMGRSGRIPPGLARGGGGGSGPDGSCGGRRGSG